MPTQLEALCARHAQQGRLLPMVRSLPARHAQFALGGVHAMGPARKRCAAPANLLPGAVPPVKFVIQTKVTVPLEQVRVKRAPRGPSRVGGLL